MNEEAVLCRWCAKDIMLFKPLMLKMSKLQERIESLELGLQALTETYEATPSLVRPTIVPLTVSLILSGSIAACSYWIAWQPMTGTTLDRFWEFLAAAAPGLAAVWLGFVLGKVPMSQRIIAGIFAGVLGFLQKFFFFYWYQFWFFHRSVAFHSIQWHDYRGYLVTYTLAGVCLYPIGYLLGSRLRRGRKIPSLNTIPESSLMETIKAVSPIIVAIIGVLSALLSNYVKTTKN